MSLTVLPAIDPQEQAVLCEAVADIERWITQLPASSGWRMAFLSARREIASVAGLRLVSPVAADLPSVETGA